MNGETFRIGLNMLTVALSVIGGLFCIYMFLGFVFGNFDKNNRRIKGSAYLVLDVDEIGEKLEYYVRKIESDIEGRYIYVSKIILYSKTPASGEGCEISKICKLLAGDYNNIIFLRDL